jgi:hypothetical protein
MLRRSKYMKIIDISRKSYRRAAVFPSVDRTVHGCDGIALAPSRKLPPQEARQDAPRVSGDAP